MTIEIKTDQPATDATRIEMLQWKYRIQFPQSYVEFLLRNNGGRPTPDNFEFADDSDASVVDSFLSVGGPNCVDLDWYLEIFRERIPRDFFPIAKDPGGNLLLMGWNGKYTNQIYFWDHDFEAEQGVELNMANMYFISPNLAHLLENLTELELE
jgi:SMI1/KNR4 family protein SUKH-1